MSAANGTMVRVGSFVFLDLETTGLPYQEGFRTKITELAMVSVNRDHMLSSELGYIPRVLQKLVLCFHTHRVISDAVVRVTGLSNKLLQNERQFDRDTVDTIKGFLERQQKPVCFVVHNGNLFDYPILRAEIDDLQMKLPDDIVCVDSLRMFRQFYKKKIEKKSTSKEKFTRLHINKSDWDVLNNLENSALSNEKAGETLQSNFSQNQPTTNQQISDEKINTVEDEFSFDLIDEVIFPPDFTESSSGYCQNNVNTVNRIDQDIDSVRKNFKQENPSVTPLDKNIFLNNSKKPVVKKVRESFKLGELYIRLLGKEPVHAHHAEGDCLMLLECCMVEPNRFVEYCDGNSIPFASIPRMQSKFHRSVYSIPKSITQCFKKTSSKPNRAGKLATML